MGERKIHQRVKGLHGFTNHCESNQVSTNHVPAPVQQQISLLDTLFVTSLTKQSITKLVINLLGHVIHNKTQCYAIYRYHHKKLRISQTYNKRLRKPVWSLVIIAWSGYQKTFRCASFCQFPVNKHKIAPDHGCKK